MFELNVLHNSFFIGLFRNQKILREYRDFLGNTKVRIFFF